jgi:ABC-type transporter Mla MlaB component
MKIVITDLSDEQKWSVQGQLVGEWAAELLSTWKKTHHAGDMRRTIVDLIEVTSIDRNGEAVLAEMMSQGAEFISGDVYTEHLLRKLRRELKRRVEKEKRHGGGTNS